jgi:hypothetical protein
MDYERIQYDENERAKRDMKRMVRAAYRSANVPEATDPLLLRRCCRCGVEFATRQEHPWPACDRCSGYYPRRY